MSTSTVLVVEDDRALKHALVDTLQVAGFEVLSAAEGGEALQILEHEGVDLVVTDVQMAPVDGRELLRRLKRTHPTLPARNRSKIICPSWTSSDDKSLFPWFSRSWKSPERCSKPVSS